MVRRSPQQQAQSLNNLRRINALDRENQDPRNSLTSAIQQELARQRVRANDNARKYRNKAREALRAKTTCDLLHAEKAQIYNAARARAARVPQPKQCAVSKALKKVKAIPNCCEKRNRACGYKCTKRARVPYMRGNYTEVGN